MEDALEGLQDLGDQLTNKEKLRNLDYTEDLVC